MSIVTPLILWLASTVGGAFHAPHDSTYGIASAALSNGQVVTAIINSEKQILVSRNDGYTWQAVHGDGLQLEDAYAITYHPRLSTPQNQGAFIIGTNKGSWILSPHSNSAYKNNFGLINSDKQIVCLDSPSSGSDGPTVAITKNGRAYLLDSTTKTWTSLTTFSTGLHFATKIAITPTASKTVTGSGSQDILVAINGQLHLSHDLGQSWTLHPQFSTLSGGVYDWSITAADFSDDYQNDGGIVIGRGRLNSAGTAGEGDIWVSGDFGGSFSATMSLDTAVTSILCSPPDSSGNRYWFAAGQQYPNYGNYFGTGILRSADGGLSWSDNGSAQDFLLEDNPGKKSGATEMYYFSQLQVAGDFATSNVVMYGRQEGLFKSKDSGVHWTQQSTRFANRFRDVDTTVDASGNDLVFGAGYGTGTVVYNADTQQSQVVPQHSPMVYQRRVSASPNYDLDGRLLVAGNVYLYEWQSPDVPASNPSLHQYWYTPLVRNSAVSGSDAGYPRGVSYSPHFDPTSTVAGADQTYFWYTAEGQARRTSDNGTTSERLFNTTSGHQTRVINCIAVAPTYDAAGTRTDAYAGSTDGILYRLIDTDWLELFDFNNSLVDIKMSPAYSRPSNPELFAIVNSAPFVYRVTDSPSGLSVQVLRHNLSGVSPSGIAMHPNFANVPIIYLSTKASGIFSLNLSHSFPNWKQVGRNIPDSTVNDICLSKNFANDQGVYLATDNDMMHLDTTTNTWLYINGTFRLDDTDESISTYSPNNPNVVSPSHMWPWSTRLRWTLPLDLKATGDEVIIANYDGDYLSCPVSGTSASLMTFTGPLQGEVEIEIIDPQTAVVVDSQSFDLETSTALASDIRLTMLLPDPTKVYTLRATADLDPGEMLVVDGIEINLN